MTQLAIHRLPKPILGRSMPLRAMVQLNLYDDTMPDVALVLHRLGERGGEPIRLPLKMSPYRGDRFLLDLRAGELVADGCYEGEITVGEERRGLNANLWVMDDKDYDDFRREIAAESFEASRGLDAEAAGGFVDRVMHAALAEDRFDLDGAFVLGNTSYGNGSSERLYPAGALRWVAEHVAMQLRYLAVAGARDLFWQTWLVGDAFRLHAHVDLEPAAAKGVTGGALEATLRDLRHLEEGASGKPVQILADMLSADRVAIQVQLALAGIPISKKPM